MQTLAADAGMSNADVLIAATRNGALALGIASATGTIEPGKAADLVILDKDPLENIENITSVNLVIKAGRIYR